MDLTSQTTFTIQDPHEEFVDAVDLLLFPENAGVNVVRELHYPGDIFPPIIYEDNPDRWENFDSVPMTARPQVKTDLTITGNVMAIWPGYVADRPVREYWSGSDKISRMTAYFFRRLWEYFINPPASDYIIWYPKDRINKGYKIRIESLQAGGSEIVLFHDPAIRSDIILGEVIFSFRIIGEA
jgi:hypothetical protein